MTGDPQFASGFPPADFSAWAALAARALDERDGPEALKTATRDGIPVEPVYSQRHPGRRWSAAERRWRVFQRVDHPDPAVASELAQADIAGGADGLEIVFPGSVGAHGFGVGVATLEDLERLLADIDLETVSLRLDGGYEVRHAIALTVALLERRKLDPARIDVTAEADPANGLFSAGRLIVPYQLMCDWGADIVRYLLDRGLNLPVYVGEGRAVHAAGGTEAQELAYALASAVEHLRMMEARGIGLEDAASMVSFSLAADADQFLTIAKLRAFRLTWTRVVEVAGLPPRPARLHVETAWRMMARRDPWVNMLRTTLAVAAAGLGEADSVLALPFTQALGLPDAFARRVARNCQLVLLEEAGLADVADPAAGSGYVEAMTEALAEAAWDGFRAIEGEGGLIAALRKGSFQGQVMTARRKREADAARRIEPIIGVSAYPWLAEAKAETLKAEPHVLQPSGEVLALPPAGDGKRFAAVVAAVHGGASVADMLATVGHRWERADKAPWWRVAEPFERLRAASDRALAETQRRPCVFLAGLRPGADFGERAAWARGVFEAGGIALVAGHAADSAEDIARLFVQSGARSACICVAIGQEGAKTDIARWLKAAGARHISCIGAPGEDEAELREAGVDDFLYEGCDILAALNAVHARLGLGDAVPAGDEVR